MTENKDVNQKNVSDNQEEVDLSKRQFIKTAGMTTGGIVGGILLGSFISKPFKTEKYELLLRIVIIMVQGGIILLQKRCSFFYEN